MRKTCGKRSIYPQYISIVHQRYILLFFKVHILFLLVYIRLFLIFTINAQFFAFPSPRKFPTLSIINPIQDGGGGKKGPLSVFRSNFNQCRSQHQKHFDFYFQPFCHIDVKLQGQTQCPFQIFELEPRLPLKNVFMTS